MMRSLVASLVLILSACGETWVQEDGPPPLYKYSSMKAAVAEGKDTLPVFWSALQGADPSLSDFHLLVVTPSKRHTEEYVWVDAITEVPAGYRGTVLDDHEMKDGFKPGDMIDFIGADIADWRYREGEKFRGAYTSRAMLDLLPTCLCAQQKRTQR